MMWILWVIIIGLVWNCVYYSRKVQSQRATITDLRVKIVDLTFERDFAKVEYQDLKAKIIQKATPEVVNRIPKKYTGPQLRVLNDRLNAQQSAELQDRPNSEILKEQVNG